MSSSAPVGTDNPKGHNAMHGNHMKSMLIGGAGLLVLLLVVGVPLATALSYAVFLACPLMMLVMMRSMGGGAGQGGRRRDDSHDATPGLVPGERVEAPAVPYADGGPPPRPLLAKRGTR